MATNKPTKKPPAKAGAIMSDKVAEEVFFWRAKLEGFDLAEFDAWMGKLPDGGRKTELPERRALAKAAATPPHSNECELLRHLEWMMLRKKYIQRMEYILPLARTGKKVRSPHANANLSRAEKAKETHDEWQRLANDKWAEPQHAGKSSSEIARLIAKKGEKANTIRRKIKKLS